MVDVIDLPRSGNRHDVIEDESFLRIEVSSLDRVLRLQDLPSKNQGLAPFAMEITDGTSVPNDLTQRFPDATTVRTRLLRRYLTFPLLTKAKLWLIQFNRLQLSEPSQQQFRHSFVVPTPRCNLQKNHILSCLLKFFHYWGQHMEDQSTF